MQDHAPPAETVAWQSAVAPWATVTAAAGSPAPEKRIFVLLVGLGTGASVGFAIDVFTTNAFAFPDGVASSPLEKSTSTVSTCGPSESLSVRAQAQPWAAACPGNGPCGPRQRARIRSAASRIRSETSGEPSRCLTKS